MAIKNLHNLTIASGASVTETLRLRNTETIVGFELPSSFTQAPLTFLSTSQDDPSAIKSMYHDSLEYALSGYAGTTQSLDPALFLHARYLQIRSGTSSTPVTQATSRTIVLITAEI